MNPFTRRKFIASTMLAGAAAACSSVPGESNEIAIIDTHTHFYDPSRPQGVPWPPKNDQVLYRTVLPAELEKIVRPLGVRGTVVVEASPVVKDNDWVLELAEKNPFIIGLVGHLKPGQPGFSEDLKHFTAHPRFRGIRTGGWDGPVAPGKSEFMRDLSALAKRNLSLDLLGGPEQLAGMARIAEAIPDLRIVVNHCAGVHISGRAVDPKWAEGIRAVARHPNVNMKISGLPEGTGIEFNAPKNVDYYRPVLEVLWNAFGEDRVIYGSNWPVSTRFADYATVLRIVREYFGEKGHRASEKYFRKNAERVYKVRL